jgi:hypothetical protein
VEASSTTTTQENIMNTNHTHKIRNTTLATFVAFTAAAFTATPAFATHTHDEGDGGHDATAVAPYAVPITALGGITLAEYVENHQAEDHRTHTVV